MSSHLTYLLVDLGCITVPFAFSFHPSIRFDREWKFFAVPGLITSLLFLIWDSVFTSKGVWGFNPDYLLGYNVFNLPLEEVLFFLCIPYSCVFTYFCIRKFLPSLRALKTSSLTLPGGVALIVIGLVNHSKLYTATTFIFCGTALLVSWWTIREFVTVFLASYLLVIPFFLLSNGILTGSFIAEPVVWYNNEENLGIRLFTIPFEDVFYGMLLILLNVIGYEIVRVRFSAKRNVIKSAG